MERSVGNETPASPRTVREKGGSSATVLARTGSLDTEISVPTVPRPNSFSNDMYLSNKKEAYTM
jgi:hypothetical protein